MQRKAANKLAAYLLLLIAALTQVTAVPLVSAVLAPVVTPPPITDWPDLPRSVLTIRQQDRDYELPSLTIALPTPVEPTDTFTSYVIFPPSPPLSWPVHGRITTYYSRTHPAIDIACNVGTPVHAPMAFTVTFAGWKTNGGGYVIDGKAGAWGFTFDHLSRIDVALGDRVAAGAVIALSGSTGNSTGGHLHFGVSLNGRWANPLAYL